MFSLLKKLSPIKDNKEHVAIEKTIYKVQTADSLLANSFCHDKLIELKQLTSCTATDYQNLYLALVKNVALFFQTFPVSTKCVNTSLETLLHLALERSIAALKIRRGYMLPIGSETETCYSEQEFWTYAIFSAALLKDVWQLPLAFNVIITDSKGNELESWQPLNQGTLKPGHFYQFTGNNLLQSNQPSNLNVLLAKDLMPLKGFLCLSQKLSILQLWCHYLSGHPDNSNSIYQIISQAENSVISKPNNTIKSNLPSKDETTIFQLQENDEHKDISNEKLPTSLEPTAIIVTTQESKGFTIVDNFTNWLKSKLYAIQSLENHDIYYFHRVKEGLLFQLDSGLLKYLEDEPMVKLVLENSSNNSTKTHLDLRDKFLNELANKKLILPNPNTNQYIHFYHRGNWELRDVIEGCLLNAELFLHDYEGMTISKDVLMDPAFN